MVILRRTKIIPIRVVPDYTDTDWDGVPDKRDCQPLNPRKQDKIYPNADVSEIIKNVKKSSVGRFFKEYKKGSFIYMIEKKPFGETTIVAVHKPTKKVFYYNKLWDEWKDTGTKFEEY